MEAFWTLLGSLAPVLYGGIGLLLLITLGQAWRAYRRLVQAFFRVEREMAAMDLFNGLARAAFLLVLGLGLWLLVGPGVLRPSSVSPTIPSTVPSRRLCRSSPQRFRGFARQPPWFRLLRYSPALLLHCLSLRHRRPLLLPRPLPRPPHRPGRAARIPMPRSIFHPQAR